MNKHCLPIIFLAFLLLIVTSSTFSDDGINDAPRQDVDSFIDLSSTSLPEEGLNENEALVLQGLCKIVDVLGKSENVEGALNGCDQYSDVVFGKEPSLFGSTLMRFLGLSFRGRSVVDAPNNQNNNDEYIMLFNGNGVIEIVRQTCSEERNGLWKEGDVVSLRKLDFRNKTAILLEFNNDGTLNKLSYEKYGFDSEKFYMTVYATLIGVSPTVQEYYPSKTVTKIKTWNRDGTFNKEENYEERGE